MDSFVLPLLVWNIFVMLIYGIDKFQAKTGGRRISEKTLLLCTFLLGGWGAMFGMVTFNHKTSKMKFRILVPVSAVVTTAVCLVDKISVMIK